MKSRANHRSRRNSIDFTPHYALTEYRQLPKQFADPEMAQRLFEIGAQLKEEKPYASYLNAAGWAFAESALIDSESGTESRHSRVNAAKECWERSKSAYLDKHAEDGWSTSKLYGFPDRIQTSLLYIPLMHDMINGCVEQETSDTLHRRLVQLIEISLNAHTQLITQGDEGARSGRYGHLLELAAVGAVTSMRSPTLTMFPPLERSDNGTFNRDSTHDMVLLHMKWGVITSSTPYEVKPRGSYHTASRDAAVVRGNSHLRAASAGLNVFSFLNALVDEQRGRATPEQVMELREVSENIIRQSVDYKSSRLRTA